MFFKLILFFITIIMSFTSFSSSDITTSGAFPGYYLVSSIGTDGDISFFPSILMKNRGLSNYTKISQEPSALTALRNP